MKFLEFQFRIMKIMKIQLFYARIIKIMKFLEFHARITKIIKKYLFHANITKIMKKKKKLYIRINKNHANQIITRQNHENHEIQKKS